MARFWQVPTTKLSKPTLRQWLWIVAIAFIVVVIVLGTWGFVLADRPFWNALYGAIQLFGLNFDYNSSTHPDVPMPLQIARFLAPIALASALVKLLADGVGTWIERSIRLRDRATPRDIVLGFGPTARAVGERLVAKGRRVTWIADIGGGDEASKRARETAERLGGLLVIGDPSGTASFDTARLDRASRVFIALDDDLAGLDAAEAVRARHLIDVRMFTENPRFTTNLPSAAASGFLSGRGVEMFNLRAEAVRNLVTTARWDRLALLLGQKRVHLVIAGCGWQGEALLEEALNLCMRASLGPPLVTIIDKDAAAVRARLKLQSPALFDPDLAVPGWLPPRVVHADIETVDIARLSLAAPGEPDVPVTAWAISTPDDGLNVRAALNLQMAMQTRALAGAPIHVRVWSGHQGDAPALATDGITHSTVFGSLRHALDQTTALDDDPDATGKALHWAYMTAEQRLREAPKGVTEDEAMRDWLDLSATKKTANRRAHRHAAMKLADMGFDWRGKALPRFDEVTTAGLHAAGEMVAAAEYLDPPAAGPPFDATAARLYAAIRDEHDRWVIDRALDGWRHAATRDESRLLHPLMVKWEDISGQGVRAYDGVLLRAVIDRRVDATASLAWPRRMVWLKTGNGRLVLASRPKLDWSGVTELGVLLPAGDVTRPERTRIDLAAAPWPALVAAVAAFARNDAACRVTLVFPSPPMPPVLALANRIAGVARSAGLDVHAAWAWTAGPGHAPHPVAEVDEAHHPMIDWGIGPTAQGGAPVMAFAGHRTLSDASAVFAALERLFQRLYWAGGARQPVLRCGFAGGADRLAVERWIALGGVVKLYFPYADPHDAGSAWTDDPATADPSCRIEFAAHGIDPKQVSIVDARDGLDPHVALARALLDGAEVLVAVWDGQPRPPDGSGDGGTAHAVEMAVARGAKVLNALELLPDRV